MTECLNLAGTVLSTGKNELVQGPVLQMPRAFRRTKHMVYNIKYYGILERREIRAVVGRVRTQIVHKELTLEPSLETGVHIYLAGIKDEGGFEFQLFFDVTNHPKI